MKFGARCAADCRDNKGRPRDGSQWIHIDGRTMWVCDPCAQAIGLEHGIPRTRVRRHQLVLKGQLSLDLAAETHIPETAEAQT